MPRIVLGAPDLTDAIVITVPAATTLLIGRDPDPARLPPQGRGGAAGVDPTLDSEALQLIRVPSNQVSANHVLVRCGAAGTQVQDLRSRNGTWLRLLPDAPATLPGGVTLELAANPRQDGKGRVPTLLDAVWATPADFPAAVVAAVQSWLSSSGVHARVAIASNAREAAVASAAASYPLAGGARLCITLPDNATYDLSWALLFDEISGYVNRQNVRCEKELGFEEDFVLASPKLRAAHADVVEAAAWGMRLLLLGPTGAGKERLAHHYHERSRAHSGPFIAVNCNVLQEGLLLAQLFGAKKGSFTSATEDIQGFVKAAHRGTLFLDEVADLDPKAQGALLRFLDHDGEYVRVGETQVHKATVQLVCATNVDLSDPRVRQGRFRDDLWYRLAVKVVRVPALHERPEDILAFLCRRRLRSGRLTVLEGLSPDALRLVLADPWPGNFRDLDNFARRLPGEERAGGIDVSTCRAALQEGRGAAPARSATASASLPPPADWVAMLMTAAQAFLEDHEQPPRQWGELLAFSEKFLKPVFVAHALGLAELEGLSRDLNYSELARQLHIGDGTTVKQHLRRYIERFRRPAR